MQVKPFVSLILSDQVKNRKVTQATRVQMLKKGIGAEAGACFPLTPSTLRHSLGNLPVLGVPCWYHQYDASLGSAASVHRHSGRCDAHQAQACHLLAVYVSLNSQELLVLSEFG